MPHRTPNFNLYRIVFLYPLLMASLLVLGGGKCFGQGPLVLSYTYTNFNTCTGIGLSTGLAGTITPSATGGTGPYLFTLNGGAPQASFSGLTSNNYTLQVSDQGGLIQSVPVSIGSGCLEFGIDQKTATCGNPNGSVTVNIVSVGASPSVMYSIDGGVTFQSSKVFPNLASGMYNIVVIDPDPTKLLVAQQSIIVGGVAGPSVSIDPMNPPQPATCNNNDGVVHLATTYFAAPMSYSVDGGAFGSSPDFTTLSSGPHTFNVLDGNGCPSSTTATVLLNNTLALTMGGDATICQSKSVPLGATTPNGVSFQWTPATGLSNPNVLNPVASPNVTTAYTLTTTWGICTTSGTETVNVNPAPVADAGPSDTTCFARSTGLQGSGKGPGTLTYLWTPRVYLSDNRIATPAVVRPIASTTYSLVVTDGNGCSSLNTSTATITVLPPPPVFAGNDTNVVIGQPVPLHAVDVDASGFVQYEWSPPIGLNNPYTQDPVLGAALQTTTFVVTGTTALGCQGVDSMTVVVFLNADIYVPNAFSPNHDGHNDVLRVIASSIKTLKVFSVYDRWGAQLFTTTNPAEGWDGTRNGREQPPGVYVWVAVGVDWAGKTVEKRGTVVLVR